MRVLISLAVVLICIIGVDSTGLRPIDGIRQLSRRYMSDLEDAVRSMSSPPTEEQLRTIDKLSCNFYDGKDLHLLYRAIESNQGLADREGGLPQVIRDITTKIDRAIDAPEFDHDAVKGYAALLAHVLHTELIEIEMRHTRSSI